MASPRDTLLVRITVRTSIVLAVAYVLLNLGIAIRNNYTINTTIRTLKTEIATLGRRVTYLRNKIVYVQSTSYRELEAKRRLGLKRRGEQVVLVAANRGADESDAPAEPSLTVDQGQGTDDGSVFDRASHNAKTWINWVQGQ